MEVSHFLVLRLCIHFQLHMYFLIASDDTCNIAPTSSFRVLRILYFIMLLTDIITRSDTQGTEVVLVNNVVTS